MDGWPFARGTFELKRRAKSQKRPKIYEKKEKEEEERKRRKRGRGEERRVSCMLVDGWVS